MPTTLPVPSGTAARFLTALPRFAFFTGKGGVGKTSIACAAAIHLADEGARVLLVSTDPASNVGQVFGATIGNAITPIPSVPGLSAIEIDPEQAAEQYRERIVGPVRGLLPEAELASIVESLSGSCTTEIASFDEFTGFLADESLTAQFDHVIFDTAPTGHTIRLLQLPGSWTTFLDDGKGDPSCLGPMAGLERQREMYAAAVRVLADPQSTRMILVARAQPSSLAELHRTHHELAEIGMTEAHLVINGVLPQRAGDEPLARAVRDREQAAIAAMPSGIAELPRDLIDLRPVNMVGVDALRGLLAPPAAETAEAAGVAASIPNLEAHALADRGLAALVDELERDGHGLIMCMGKGGVGKTTVAAALAVALAHRGHDVHLTTTDPAAHLIETLHGDVDRLTVSRIDPAESTRLYREHVMATKGAALDGAGRAALAEDLMSPCTDEVAVFQQFSKVISAARSRFVIVDTAPTGHTLLLLDATGSYHREIARNMPAGMHFTTPMMRLQDPALTKMIIVTLAETTPVLEAAELQADLARAGITPWAWVINNSVAAAQPESPFLRQRARAELEQIDRVRALAPRVAVLPLLGDEPVGEDRLAALSR
ncbi:MAG: arsenical pump-driving ATPase [Microcella sp.]|uniref:arsenical pump-driving ATPase n=1 Tax=Microcella sp. TaxID=1913979 RepID=UPI0024CBBDE3|nr:arsenical pump-driving ATPase [Microcella sp.]UYN82688.1 MAG: arsenical pump-driving ATPase [Microcella sp.]